MNDRAKSIAKKLRRLAKYEIPCHAFTSRVVSEIITEIADELDPPEPEPEFAGIKVDDWVLLDTGNQCPVIRVYTDNQGFAVKYRGAEYYFDLMGNSIYSNDEFKVLRELEPTEVEVEIKLKGTVSKATYDSNYFCLHTPNMDAPIAYDDIDSATAEIIRGLIKAQKEKS